MSEKWIAGIVSRQKEANRAKVVEDQKEEIRNARFDALIDSFWEMVKERLSAAVAEYNRLIGNAERHLQTRAVGAYQFRIDAPPAKSGRPLALEVELVPKAHLLKTNEPYSTSRHEPMFKIEAHSDGLHLCVGAETLPDSQISEELLKDFFSRL